MICDLYITPRRGRSKIDVSIQERKAKGTIHVESREGPCRLENAKEVVSKMKGVFSVEANHVSHMLTIQYDPDKVTLDQIRKTVESNS
jgi:Heavy-metal-associated domain